MTRTIFPITRERHGDKKWLRSKTASYAASESVAPLGISETLNAARAFPLGFVEINGKPTLAAIMGLKQGHNLFVAPNGRWVGPILPMAFQFHPFSLGQAGDQNLVLCIDEASGLIKDQAVGEEGFPFFDRSGTATPDTLRMLEDLGKARRALEVVDRATASIIAKGLLEPWPINYKEDGNDSRIEGVQRVSEPALNALSPVDLAALRDAGGLAIAYCQLFSMGNVSLLGQLYGARNRAEKQRMTIPENSFMPQEDDSLKIDWDAFLKDK